MGYLNEILELEAMGLSKDEAARAHFEDMVRGYEEDEEGE